jgi:hypothetical protein
VIEHSWLWNSTCSVTGIGFGWFRFSGRIEWWEPIPGVFEWIEEHQLITCLKDDRKRNPAMMHGDISAEASKSMIVL